MKAPAAILLSALLCLNFSCSRSHELSPATAPDLTGEILAVVGDERISASEFEAELNRRSQGLPGIYATAEQRARLLEEMIRLKAALAQARATGFDRDPAMVTLVERLIAERFQEAEFARRFDSDPVVSDEQVAAFYEENAARFRTPAAVRAGVVWMKASPRAEPERRAELRARAKSIRLQAQQADDASFNRIVQQHSDHQSTRYIGGDTGWLRADEHRPEWNAAVVEAAFALEQPGEVAPLVESPDGYYIVRLMTRQPAGIRPLAEVGEAIRYQLLQSKRQQQEQEFSAALKDGLHIEINHTLFESIPAPVSPSIAAGPPVLPGN
jgi:parvulin-like peptidyl-prolyl isomerase